MAFVTLWYVLPRAASASAIAISRLTIFTHA